MSEWSIIENDHDMFKKRKRLQDPPNAVGHLGIWQFCWSNCWVSFASPQNVAVPAALGLAKHGFAVTLLEQGEVVGGRVRTTQVRQKAYDLGATWLHGRSTEQNPLLRRGSCRFQSDPWSHWTPQNAKSRGPGNDKRHIMTFWQPREVVILASQHILEVLLLAGVWCGALWRVVDFAHGRDLLCYATWSSLALDATPLDL